MFDAERIAGIDFEPNLLIDFIRPPFRRFQFSTRLSPEHAAKTLQHIVEPRIFEWWPSKRHGYFEGTIEGDRFKISRIINGRNPFVPIIEGTFRHDGAMDLVTLNVRMAWPVLIFWLGFMLSLLWFLINNHDVRLIGMLVFAYLMATVCFSIEVRIAMKRLLGLLRAGSAGSGLSI